MQWARSSLSDPPGPGSKATRAEARTRVGGPSGSEEQPPRAKKNTRDRAGWMMRPAVCTRRGGPWALRRGQRPRPAETSGPARTPRMEWHPRGVGCKTRQLGLGSRQSGVGTVGQVEAATCGRDPAGSSRDRLKLPGLARGLYPTYSRRRCRPSPQPSPRASEVRGERGRDAKRQGARRPGGSPPPSRRARERRIGGYASDPKRPVRPVSAIKRT